MDVGDQDVQNLNIELKKNSISVQLGNTGDMLFTVNRLIEEVSKYFTLKIGDLIFTGTPAGVAAVSKNDELEAFIEGQSLLKLRVK
jgi:2-keto-4-pentenoate hydratase/2-oxohepta-3-ene-1,7-dioic acid hydratase in catechol pathway